MLAAPGRGQTFGFTRRSCINTNERPDMNEHADAPKISDTDLDHSNPNNPADTALDSSPTLPETADALQANDAERMTPDEANELSNDQ